VLRKRKQPTPHFKQPPPYEPISGDRAALAVPGFFPYVAMMQVAAEDTYEDYVICRGFDIRHRIFIDYEEGNADKPGIPVAKPYSNREVGVYSIAEVYPAVLPLQTSNPSPADVPWRVGQNPGVAETTAGHPADLDETIEILYTDDESQTIDWMLLDSRGSTGDALVGGCLSEDHPGRGMKFGILLGEWDPVDTVWVYDQGAVTAIDWRYGVPYPDAGSTGLFVKRRWIVEAESEEEEDEERDIYEVVALDCSSPGECGD